MEFGYFTLSDNRYPDNPRTSEQFLLEIRDQAIYAEELGMHSAWIGEHHFNRRGCVPVPGLTLANIAASTKRIRLGPAVVVLNIHHPIHVAEEWGALDQLSGGRVDFACGRGYDAHEFAPFGADFQASAEQFTEAVQLLTKCWTETEPFTFDGEFYSAPDPIVVDPKPMQDPFRPYMGSFSSFSMEIAADLDWNLLQAPFAATMVFGGLEQAVQAYRDICEKKEKEARKVKCSYFIHMGETDSDKDYALARLIEYFTLSGLRKKSTQGGAGPLPPTMQYYRDIGKVLADPKKDDFDHNSILLGGASEIIDQLKKVEGYGIDEVILYFNLGAKPDAMVREQMQRFMEEVAPAFEGSHIAARAAE